MGFAGELGTGWTPPPAPPSVDIFIALFRTSFRRNHHMFVNRILKPSVAKEMSHFLVSSLNPLAIYR